MITFLARPLLVGGGAESAAAMPAPAIFKTRRRETGFCFIGESLPVFDSMVECRHRMYTLRFITSISRCGASAMEVRGGRRAAAASYKRDESNLACKNQNWPKATTYPSHHPSLTAEINRPQEAHSRN